MSCHYVTYIIMRSGRVKADVPGVLPTAGAEHEGDAGVRGDKKTDC